MSTPLDRRTLLRAAGTSLALPMLEAMAPARSPDTVAPTRLLWMYVPNGVNVWSWRSSAEGEAWEPTPTLEPLVDLRSHVSVLSGLTCDKARANGDGAGDHARSAAAFLTCTQPFKSAGELRVGVSADQLAAQELGLATPFRSLQLGGQQGRASGECDSGYACAYSNNVSWTTPSTPATKETDPLRLFERLFLGGTTERERAARAARDERRASLLDHLRGDVARLAQRLGSADRSRLDEYLTAVREVERRIRRFANDEDRLALEAARPPEQPGSFRERIELLCELTALAFETDQTRIVTLMVANEGSNRTYSELEVREGHHGISHHEKNPEKLDWIARIDRMHVELLAHLLRRLAETPEPGGEGGSLLDHSLVCYGSAIADGNRHGHHDLPILLAGRGSGAHRPGRHLRYGKETPLANLHLAMLRAAGSRAEAFADGDGALGGLA